MSINLSKGQTINLAKSSGGTLTNVRMGLGWDERQAAPVKKGFFARMAASAGSGGIDLDASVILIGGGRVHEIVYFGNLKSKDGSIKHTGDNLTGAGDGDDESILVDLSKVPGQVEHLVFTINSFSGESFNQIANAVARMVDSNNRDEELVRYELTGAGGHTAMVMAKVSRSGGGWAFTAIGQPGNGRTAKDLQTLALRAV
ncbi:TerD family protein [Pedococcus sp. KACC 23699]|uniref:TerD family protein n=1 Tax=Pedococcus sp. KACC 23699 TaxID=3149228 RepID=A0AAU7JY69_9MICO